MFGQCPDAPSRSTRQPAEEDINTIAMDYAPFAQNIGEHRPDDDAADIEEAEDAAGQAVEQVIRMFVLQDVVCDAIVSYPFRAKGLLQDARVVHQIMQDLETLGVNGRQYAIQCGQGSAFTEVRKELQRLRAGAGTKARYTRTPGSATVNPKAEWNVPPKQHRLRRWRVR